MTSSDTKTTRDYQRIIEEQLGRVLTNIEEAKTKMAKVMSASQDWTAKIEVEAGFDNLAKACRDFANFQLGLKIMKKGRK